MPLVVAAKCNEPAERAYFAEHVAPRLGPGVEWIGEADTARKKDLLARARCLVLPLQWEEPFRIVMVEALACARPVVALALGAAPEIVVDGESGFLCRTPEELPAALEASAGIEPQARRARARAFDVARMVAGYESVYAHAAGTQAPTEEAENANRPDSLLSDIARTQPRLRTRVRGVRTQYRSLGDMLGSLRQELEGPEDACPTSPTSASALRGSSAQRHLRARGVRPHLRGVLRGLPL